MFRKNNSKTIFKFLDNKSNFIEEFKIMLSFPKSIFLTAVLNRLFKGRQPDIRNMIQEYLATPDILLLQIKSCCEGLNLQSYREIYFTSPRWNPAIEDQAIARAHRIGQKNTCLLYTSPSPRDS